MNASIAVVIPVRNGMAFLDETFASIWAQNYTPLEVVVVDDGSTDGSREKVHRMKGTPVRLLELDGVGPAAARNAGIRSSQSELLAFLDADDLWVNGALHRLAADNYPGMVVLEVNTRRALGRDERNSDLAESLAFAREHLTQVPAH